MNETSDNQKSSSSKVEPSPQTIVEEPPEGKEGEANYTQQHPLTEQEQQQSEDYSTSSKLTQLEECEALGIPREDCTENAILAKKRLAYSSSQSSSFADDGTIQITNLHSWVSSKQEAAATAFVVKNVGSNEVTISSISMRGISVPTDSWWSTTEATSAQMQSPLPVSYTVNTGNVAGISGTFTSGLISLEPGQAAVVYLLGAGGMQPIDAGNTYAIQIQAGHAGTVKQVQVITAD